MRQFTLTALVSQDKRLVGVFRVLQHCPALDGEALQNALSKFIEQPYQNIVRKQNDVIYLDVEHLQSANKICEVEVVTFALWRAAVALRHSKALEVSEIKHGSNWLIQPAEEPYLVKFVLEDQGHNYIILNALPVLGPSVTITDSGWLPISVPPVSDDGSDHESAPDTSSATIISEFVDTAQKKGLTALAHQTPRLPNYYSEQIVEPDQGSMSGFKFGNEFGDTGMFEKPLSEGFAEGLGEIRDRMLESRSASKALLGEEQESFLAEAALRGQTAARIPMDDSPYIPSGGVRESAKALLLESNPVHNYYESESEVPTTHTELGDPTLEI